MLGLGAAELAATLGAAAAIGVLIVSVGIGGLLLPPMLIGLGGLPVHEALAVSMAGFMLSGLAAIALVGRQGVRLRGWWPLIAATVPGALAGAVVLWAIPAGLVIGVLAVALLASGVRVLARSANAPGCPLPLGPARQVPIGAAAGFVSALTGTGGPMALVPALLGARVALPSAIALGQVAQLPISGMATLGNLARGSVDLAGGLAIGLAVVPGVVVGHRLAAALPFAVLARATAAVMIASGALLAWRLAAPPVG